MKKVFFGVLLAIALLGSQAGISAAPERGAEPKVHRLNISGKDWALELTVSPDFSSVKQFEKEDGFYLQNKKTDFNIMADLEKAPVEGDASAASEYYAKKDSMGPLKPVDIKQYELGEAAVREYTIKDSRFRTISGDTLVVRNVNYFLVHDGYWAVIRISKLRFQASDKKFFDEIIRNIKIVPMEPTSR